MAFPFRISALPLALLLLGSCSVEARPPKMISIEVKRAQPGAPHALGIITAKHLAVVSSPRGGAVATLHVDVGDTVASGDPLVVLTQEAATRSTLSAIREKQQEFALVQTHSAELQNTAEQRQQFLTQQLKQERSRSLQQLATEEEALSARLTEGRGIAEQALFDVLDASTNLLYERMDGVENFADGTAFDYHRRKEIYYNDQETSEVFEGKLHALFGNVKTAKKDGSVASLLPEAIDVGRDARLLMHGARPSPALPGERIRELNLDLERATEELNRVNTEQSETAERLSGTRLLREKTARTPPPPVPIENEAAKRAAVEAAKLEREIRTLQSAIPGDRTITAPKDGIILSKSVEEGSSVFAGQTLLAIADVSEYVLQFALPEDLVHAVRPGMPIAILPESAAEAESGTEHSLRARILRIAPVANPLLRTVLVDATMEDPLPQSVRLNSHVHVFLPIDTPPAFATVPEDAVTKAQDEDSVWTLDPERRPSKRSIDIAFEFGGLAYVRKGLKPGERALMPAKKSDAKRPIAERLNLFKTLLSRSFAKNAERLERKTERREEQISTTLLERRERRLRIRKAH